MEMLRRVRPGGPGRDAPRSTRYFPARGALIALALVSLGLEGCANGRFCGLGLGQCGGGLGLGQCGGLNLNLFHRRAPVVDSCEPGLMEGVPVEAVPASPGTLLPAPAGPPVLSDEPATLLPNPTSGTGTRTNPSSGSGSGGSTSSGSNSTGSTGAAGRAVYETRVDPRRGGPSSARLEPVPAGTDDPLADLPKLVPPGDSASAASPPVPPPAEETGKAASTSRATEPKVDSSVEAVAAIPAELPPVATAPVGSLAPGISRFKVLEPRLAAGSLPSAAGWAWLAETGYRTVLDLREPTEVKTSELAEINHQGLRYVACPFDSQSIDAKQLARFYAEIEQDPARPLFVFDLDASRPAALWYIHQVEKRLETTEIAAREIEELGATGHPLLVAANTYLKARKQESAPAPATSSPGARKPETQAVSPRTETVAPIAALVPRSAPEPQATGLVIPANSAEPRSETIPDEEGHELDLPTESPADHSWKTMAGIVTTGLGFPLLFMSGRQVVQTARARASLPSPSRGTRALPSSSDE